MAYVDLNTIQTIATGQIISAALLTQTRDNFEFLIDPPAASVFNSVAQSINDDTYTVLTADSENFDNDAQHSTSTNTGRLTAQTAGRYLYIATVQFPARPGSDETDRSILDFFYNGTDTVLGDVRQLAASPVTVRATIVRSKVMAVGDHMQVRANQNTGGAANVKLDEFVGLFLTR